MARWALVLLLLLPIQVTGDYVLLEPLVPNGASSGDDVGHDVALDYPWLAVAAPGASSVHMYHFEGGWTLRQTLTSASDGFGASLALDDGRLAVGAPDVNRVLTWRLDGSTWRPDTTLNGERSFGSSLAMDGNALVVGAPGAARFSDWAASGMVSIFEYNGGWRASVTMERGGIGAETRFGAAVDLDGQRLIVGAPAREIEDEVFDGGIYIFEKSNGWQQQAHFTGSQWYSQPGSFGNVVAIEGRWAIGADPATIFDSVLIYGDLAFYELRGNQWVLTQETTVPSHSLDLRDGTLATASAYNDWIQLWHWQNGKWRFQDAIDEPTGHSGSFGRSVALDRGHLVVGDPNFRERTTTGAAWTFVKNLAPVAIAGPELQFKVDETPDTVRVHLDGRKSYDPDGSIEAYRWTGGGKQVHQSHTYVDLGIGSHRFDLHVTDDHGFTDTDVTWVHVTAVPPLKASFTFSPDGVLPGAEVRFTDRSTHAAGTIMTWDWDFDGDGRVDATGQNPVTRYTHSGTFDARLTIHDEHGKSATAMRQVHIGDAPPTADAGDDFVVQEYNEMGQGMARLDGRKSYDPEGELEYDWSIGGIPIGSGETVDWNFDEGITTVRLLVRDEAGQSATDRVDVLVPRGGANGTYGYNDPPDVAGSWRPHPQAIPHTLVFKDASTDARTDVAFVSWDFDGDSDSDSEATELTWRFPGPGQFDVTHAAVDMDGARAERTFQVTVKDRPPVAAFTPRALEVAAGTPVVFHDQSRDLEGPIVAWHWNFDGQNSARQDVGIVFQRAGEHHIQLTVTDGAGQQSTANGTITVTEVVADAAVQSVDVAGHTPGDAAMVERPDPDAPKRDANGDILPGEEGSPFKVTAEVSSSMGLWWLWLLLAALIVGLLAWRLQRPSPSSRVK